MDARNILSRKIYQDTPTIALLDEFESRNDDGTKKYDTLFLRDVFCIKYYNHQWWVGLYIQRRPKAVECIDSNLTFTKLKKDILDRVFSRTEKHRYQIIHAVFACIPKIPDFRNVTEVSSHFDSPVKFNAQNSSNRCGYGNRYRFGELVYEGTLYGETTDYMFVGAQFRRW